MKLCTKLTALALRMRPFHVTVRYGRGKVARHYCWTLTDALDWCAQYGAFPANLEVTRGDRLVAYRYNVGAIAVQAGFVTVQS